ncbi:MAG: flagellar motor switch protein FliN [Candidatus Eremiobacteraeota bacterium]|nr:flagellar motor switch protein FliN [Candidatus Eremiobacteraeota bacterium]
MNIRGSAPADDPEPPNLALLMNVGLHVCAQLGTCTLTVGEILGIGTGSIVELDRRHSDPVDLIVNGKRVARGEIVAVEEQLGVRVTEVFDASP